MHSFLTDGMTYRPLPEKKRGRHRFVAIASYVISDEVARKAETHEAPAILDQENLWDVSIGCIDCEQPWTSDMKRFCDAPGYVDPRDLQR